MKIFNEIYIYKHPERGRGYIAQWFYKSEIKEYFGLWGRKYVKMY